MVRRLLAAAALAAVVLAAPSARADARAELEKARAAYLARNYAEAEERLRALVDPKSGLHEQGLVSQARMYLGAVLLAEDHKDQATEAFQKLVLEDPTFEPDPLAFPGPVINAFIDVRAQLRERIRAAAESAARLDAERKARDEAQRRAQAAWLERVKAMAEEDKTTVRNSRLVAFVPFGAGQFQNRQPVLGWIFLGTEAALAAGTAITLPMYAYARSRENEELGSGDIERKAQGYHDRAEGIRITNLSLVGALVAVAAVGVVQANLVYVPETTEVKKRELPAVSKLAPVVSTVSRADGTPTGLFVGVRGLAF
jgi:tetratricopeptide (TPR) repeat protein